MDREVNQDVRLEELFSELEGILQSLEDRNLPLEDSFSCYQKGMLLLKACSEKIDKIEKQVQVLEEGQLNEF